MFLRRRIVPAGVAGAAALALYIATMAPGLIAIDDTPKFQFVGRVLGTAHPPGSPFYVVVSHVFGLLRCRSRLVNPERPTPHHRVLVSLAWSIPSAFQSLHGARNVKPKAR